jgi:protein disulfide-isomerase
VTAGRNYLQTKSPGHRPLSGVPAGSNELLDKQPGKGDINPMQIRSLIVLAALLGAVPLARADETLPLLKVGDKVYKQVLVTKVTATDVYFTSSDGMGNAKLKNLEPELQRHFHYDPDKAAALEQQQKIDTGRYHEAVLHQPPAVVAAAQEPWVARTGGKHSEWGTDLPAALNQARTEHKNVLLDFTGSDWCEWCMKFDADVLKQSDFLDYAGKNLILVRLDFPRRTPLSPELTAANEEAGKRFHVEGYPTFILLSDDGRELGRQVGYREGGPAAFIAELNSYAGR